MVFISFAFLASFAIVVGRNESAFDELSLLPPPMRGTTRRDQAIELFGRKLNGPVLIGPTGMTGMLWPRGEIEAGRAAAAAGTVYTMRHGATVKMEDLALEAPGNLWMQVFPYKDRGLTQSFAERAHAAGVAREKARYSWMLKKPKAGLRSETRYPADFARSATPVSELTIASRWPNMSFFTLVT